MNRKNKRGEFSDYIITFMFIVTIAVIIFLSIRLAIDRDNTISFCEDANNGIYLVEDNSDYCKINNTLYKILSDGYSDYYLIKAGDFYNEKSI